MKKTLDGNTAVALMMYNLTEFAGIYPITPSSVMAEVYEEMSSKKQKNIYDKVSKVFQMQSEAGVAGALHGALVGGTLSTTFTASQGLLLMLPNMYKIAGELLPTVINVSARSLATHALNIFGDHSDVMAVRGCGFAFMCASNVQECQDFSVISFLASLSSQIPFLHFFDGFRTSHEIQKIDFLEKDDLKRLINYDDIKRFKDRAISSKKPYVLGTNQNPDVFFQNREASNVFYANLPRILSETFDKFNKITGRKYNFFEYIGNKNAKKIIVSMGSSCNVIKEYLQHNKIKDVALIKVNIYKPFNEKEFVSLIPNAEMVCVLDRVKESASMSEPLFSDVATCLQKENINCKMIGGRYGLGGKDFDYSSVDAVIENMKQENPKKQFTVNINDDVTLLSLPMQNKEFNGHQSCLIYGIGSDGSVGASKNLIKIIGENTEKQVQGYFEYDSKKSGSITISHLRFSDEIINSSYLIKSADVVCVSNERIFKSIDFKDKFKNGSRLIINTEKGKEELLSTLSSDFVQVLKEKNVSIYLINAFKIANELGLGNKINNIMQSSILKVLNLITNVDLKEKQEYYISKTYFSKGDDVVNKNIQAVNEGYQKLIDAGKVETVTGKKLMNENKTYIETILSKCGDELPVSAFEPTGKAETNTSKLEKRNISNEVPKWIKENCVQCNMCAISCPHGVLRPCLLESDNEEIESVACKGKEDLKYTMQIKCEDCTGCGICVKVCPAKQKALKMTEKQEVMPYYKETDKLIEENKIENNVFDRFTVKGSQFCNTYFEFSGACAGCGETPYIKLLTQLFGNNMIIANATGCSSIYGASCPTCPYALDKNGNGPAWANSLFEDNAEFGLGIKLANEINGKDESVWIVGGDGWAYDIGYGGLDHILASGKNVNVLVLDTELYSNTGGQMSKASRRGMVTKFASNGKNWGKKPLSEMALLYGDVYVAQISLGANMAQAVNAFKEANEYNGVSLIIAYCPCINHGLDMSTSNEEMKNAVRSGYWPLFRYNPEKAEPLSIDSKATMEYFSSIFDENRYKNVKRINAENAEKLLYLNEQDSEQFVKNLDKFTKKD